MVEVGGKVMGVHEVVKMVEVDGDRMQVGEVGDEVGATGVGATGLGTTGVEAGRVEAHEKDKFNKKVDRSQVTD